jgi:hypothetical protein
MIKNNYIYLILPLIMNIIDCSLAGFRWHEKKILIEGNSKLIIILYRKDGRDECVSISILRGHRARKIIIFCLIRLDYFFRWFNMEVRVYKNILDSWKYSYIFYFEKIIYYNIILNLMWTF